MNKEVKICGTTSIWDLETSIRAGADSVGIITNHHERGNIVTKHRAGWFIRSIPENTTSVVVSCFTDVRTNLDVAQRFSPDRIQLGETEDPRLAEAVYGLKDGPKVAQVIHVSDDTTPDRLSDFLDFVDYIHLDTYHPSRPGGTGQTHNWEVSREIADAAHDAGKLVLLAGGLTVSNVRRAIETVRPDGVDVESGIKDISGAHDPALVGQFVQAANAAFQVMEVAV